MVSAFRAASYWRIPAIALKLAPMLILASASDELDLLTANPGSIDVHASWMDNVAGAVGPGRTNTATITTAATTTIVGPPQAGTERNVKTLYVRNRGSASSDIAIVHTDGSTLARLLEITLPAGSTLQYVDSVGFLALTGRI